MNQSVLNSGQFRQVGTVNPVAAVSLLDVGAATPARGRRFARWPIVAVVFGAILTVIWDGFLLWQIARLVVFWVDPAAGPASSD